MRALVTATAMAAALAVVPSIASAQLELPRVSPNASVSQTLGTTPITVNYCRPGVKGRTIWGDLVPYGEVWRTGANEATRFISSDDLMVAGKKLPAGTYQLATIPGKDEWTIIFNTAADEWGAYSYDEKKDVLRVTVKPAEAPFVERMRFEFDNLTDDSADLVLRWDKLSVAIPLKVDVVGTTLAKARKAVAAAAADDWRTPMQAASFCLQSDTALDDAMTWTDASIKIKKTPQNLGLKARLLAKQGKTADAIATVKEAIALGKEQKANVGPLEKLLSEWEGTK